MPADTTALNDYVSQLFVHEDEALRTTQTEADHNGLPQISLAPHEGRLLQFLALAVGATKAVEIGTLAGYSGTWLARALPAGGKLYTLEKSSKHAQVARASFERAGVADKVELLEGDALDSLKRIEAHGPFDIVFIDADKGGYPSYLAWAVKNLRVGGMVAAHNAFRGGGVITPQNDDDRGMDAFNRSLAEHPHLESTILAIGDGMAVAIKKQ